MSQDLPTIVVVEDDDGFRNVLVQALKARRFDAKGVADAIAAAKHDSPEMAVVDLRLPDQSGLDVVRALKAIDPSTAIVVLTGYGSQGCRWPLLKRGLPVPSGIVRSGMPAWKISLAAEAGMSPLFSDPDQL